MPPSNIELLFDAVLSGDVTLPEAQLMARAPEIAGTLTPALVVRLSHQLLRQSFGDDWRVVLDLHQLLRLAIGAAGVEQVDAAARLEATVDWIEIARVALWHMPDPALYWDARRLGEEAWRAARVRGVDSEIAAVGFRMGTLHLDPWFAQRSREQYASAYGRWLERYTHREYEAWPGTADGAMPKPIEAARLASEYLAEAAARGVKGERGRALKALLQVRDWEAVLQGKPAPADTEMALEALLLLYEDEAANPVLGLITDRIMAGQPFEESVIQPILDSFTGSATRSASPIMLDALIRLHVLRAQREPTTALQELLALSEAARAAGHGALTMARYNAIVSATIAVGERDGGAVALRADAPLARQAPPPAPVDTHDPVSIRRFARALALCEASRAPCREDEAAHVMEQWLLHGLPDDAWREVGRYLTGSYWLGAGANAYERSQWGAAVDAYAHAVPHLAAAGLADAGMDCLERVADVLRYERRASLAAVEILAPVAADVRRRLGNPARDVMRAIGNVAVNSMSAAEAKDPALAGKVSQLAS